LPTTQTHSDQMHRKVTYSFPLKRIISLVPSQTELLCYLGLGKELIGLTKFCIHPADVQSTRHIVGGTKNLQLDKIAALQPDLIIGNKEENQQEQIEALLEDFPVWMSDIQNLDDALDMIRAIGQICDKQTAAAQLQSAIQAQFATLHLRQQPLRTAYLIWRKPYMVVAGGTFINDLLQRAGFLNVFGNENRYPQKTAAELFTAQPEIILLSSEPYPFKDRHMQELQEICPQANIRLVDGELFSWYGNRLLYSASYFANLRKEINRS
jgi:ABC-type Fe3+-hydroxamate transport system substrate-binding protein